MHAVDSSVLEKVAKYIDHPLMDPDQIKNDSKQLQSLCNWCVSAFNYAATFQKVKDELKQDCKKVKLSQ